MTASLWETHLLKQAGLCCPGLIQDEVSASRQGSLSALGILRITSPGMMLHRGYTFKNKARLYR